MKKSTLADIQQFAKTATKRPAAKDEMSYFEILGTKVNQTMIKAKQQAIRWHIHSEQHTEDTEQLAAYMIDYTNALVKQGMNEADALVQTEKIFAVNNPDNPLLKDPQYASWQHYYATMDQHLQEAIGLIYFSSVLLGLAIGAGAGIFGQILYNGVMIGHIFWMLLVVGAIAGLGIGMAINAHLVLKQRDNA
ncbi:hypothetical protein IV38_GL001255 [Lactobacillus selangorensis]|uniref:Uncharacterized protein n=1 Tax=Lactobacillus selangorensis TaxID=81857 RepID=A0A0R2FN82_9LACO|nr:hypothetical protein [Lactobacillus selangorensis]KRN29039.1 hypothetical protein IV38_GL001255 [Lactobacillus selangorensis]KRN30047.1 hypothetical protein IV40_GL002076 [Lactobacillus selangorensis]